MKIKHANTTINRAKTTKNEKAKFTHVKTFDDDDD